MCRYIFCLLLAVSCCALDLFSIKGRPTGVSSRLRNGRSSVRTTPKFVPSAPNKTETRNFETRAEITLKDYIAEDENSGENATMLNLPVNQNVTADDTGISLNEVNENSVSNETESEFNKTIFQNEEAYETEVFLGDVLRQRMTSNETGYISNETIYQSTEVDENGMATQDAINQTTSANETNIQAEVSIDSMEQSATSEELKIPQKNVQKRSIRNLSPGEEFLLSVANYEDAKSRDWRRLPYLMSLLQKGKLNVAKGSKTLAKRKADVNRQSEWPMEMLEMMQNLEEEDKSDESDKSTSLLSKWSADPMSLILSAIIPISVLIAAVLPILSDQFTTGMYIPTVSTTATGDRSVRKLEEKNTTEFFAPLLESLVSLGAQTFEDITEERYNETKTRFLKETFEKMTSFVSDRWKRLRNRFSKHKISCDQKNCTAPTVP
ncbi:hypothetical protein AVEN_69782-1 [Araneus ventricosus]|uniref:Uncharacterized protein n=1 Tax=Araneus ventricosus TaxID=182803 RepID=A0A4Y2CXJ2_ARAVE|nr:hypothetical protein AVEN_69782-1 [Araneus ventricosus]